MQTTLRPHPSLGSPGLEHIGANVDRRTANLLRLRYAVIGDISRILVPPPAAPLRTDRLWEGTCFELFLRREGEEGYLEFNFSPSGQWAAYSFSAYRAGMGQADIPAPPEIRTTASPSSLEIEVAVSLFLENDPYAMNLTAVVQNRTGGRSYWAAHHPAGEPDFHHPGCFRGQLPAAGSS